MSLRLPEACSGLRRLLRGLPSAVYHVVTATNLQRSGCIHCGIGEHSTYDCPFLDKDVADRKAEALYRRWVSLVAEELLIFSRCSTTAYVDAAHIRFANRPDLPVRRPRRIQRVCIAGSSVRVVPRQPPEIQEPLLPTPVANKLPERSQFQAAKPKPSANLPISAISQAKPKPASTNGGPGCGVSKAPIAPPKAKAKSPARDVARVRFVQDPPNADVLPVDSASQMVSQDLNALPPQQLWEDDNTYMDDAALLCSIARISRDVEMLQASLIGNRRRRDFTPGSADRDRPDKFIRVDETPSRCLNFLPAIANSSSSSAGSSSASSASSDAGSPLSAANADYENWDVERYVQARHLSARQRFWQQASDAAKTKMVRGLYDQPAGTPATIQARENGWIPC